MFANINKYFTKATRIIKKKINGMTEPVRIIIFSYACTAMLITMTYYAAWIFMWLNNKESLPNLLALLKEVVSPAVVGFVSFIALSFVDSDGDGIPDSIDKINDKKEDEEDHP